MAEAHEARLTAAGNEMSASFLAAKKRSDETLAKLEENPGKFTMLTGDRPTGRLHLGHFFGSIKERVAMQNRGVNTNIIIADYQVITDRDTTEHIDDNVLNLVIDYMAAGIDPEQARRHAESQKQASRKGGWTAPVARRKKIDPEVGEYVKFKEVETTTQSAPTTGDTRQTTVEQQIEDVKWEDIV